MPERKSRERVRERVKAHRQRLRARGLRPVQFWLPDVTSPEFIAEARRQSQVIAQSPGEEENIDFVESISVIFEEE